MDRNINNKKPKNTEIVDFSRGESLKFHREACDESLPKFLEKPTLPPSKDAETSETDRKPQDTPPKKSWFSFWGLVLPFTFLCSAFFIGGYHLGVQTAEDLVHGMVLYNPDLGGQGDVSSESTPKPLPKTSQAKDVEPDQTAGAKLSSENDLPVYSLELGQFPTLEEAKSFYQTGGKGLDVYIVKTADPSEAYSVRSGYYSQFDDAYLATQELREDKNMEVRVMKTEKDDQRIR